jgi:hypothetical protein
VAFICYFGVTIAGYAVFGNAVAENVLESIGQPLLLISLAEACVVLHVAASCQVSCPACNGPSHQMLKGVVEMRVSADILMQLLDEAVTCQASTPDVESCMLWILLGHPRCTLMESCSMIIFSC